MARVLAVNNYPTKERFERLEKCVRGNGATVTSIDWSDVSASKFDSYDGVVLSGSPDMLSDPKVAAKYSGETEAIVDSKATILGVCFGHQMLARAFGAEVAKDGRPVLGMVKTRVLERDPLFDGLPNRLMLLESRHEIVKSLPKGFRHLAKSETSRIAAMKHSIRPLYGVQFHPERYTRKTQTATQSLGISSGC